ncbi:shikimate dehydrogenase [Candidatus Gracilibacteria bacterium]|nr:shikimate dehydrogenase [Candidatus Gracilibacteria bacterium]
MKKFAVIGFPITHSKSPALHNAGFQEFQIEAEFEAIEVPPENLELWIKNEFRPNFQGAAVTIPHKETIGKFLDLESEAASKIGAVNTLYWEKGKLAGTNTDCIGALKALQTRVNPSGKKALILGAGGASRAIIFALCMAQADVFLWNRTKEKAERLAQEFKISHIDLLEKINPEDFDIIINTTSVGLNEMKSVLPASFWSPHHTAFDIVYSPLETQFLRDAQNAGAHVVTGDHMLVHQAVEQFRIWHGVDLDPDVMSEAFFG